jgi:hypothetical protein
MQSRYFCNVIFSQLNTWFKVNKLSLNYEKTNFVQFRTKNLSTLNLKLQFNDKPINNKSQTKFMGILLDSTLQWKGHIELITPKLCAACYALRTLSHNISRQVLVMVYFSYFHSIMSYGIIFWGTSAYSNNVFKLQKKGQYNWLLILTRKNHAENCFSNFKF